MQRGEWILLFIIVIFYHVLFFHFISFKYFRVCLLEDVLTSNDAMVWFLGGLNSLPHCISYLEILHFKLFPHVCHCFSRGAVCPSSSSTSGRPSHQSTLSIFTIQTLIKAVICQPEWNSVLRRPWFVECRDRVWVRPRYEVVSCTQFRFTHVSFFARRDRASQWWSISCLRNANLNFSSCEHDNIDWKETWLQHCDPLKGDKLVTPAHLGPALKTRSHCVF